MTKWVFDPNLSFAENRRKRLEIEGGVTEQAAPPTPKVEVDDDLIPDVLPERTEEDIQLDNVIGSIGILDAYRRWIGKEVDEKTTRQTEGIKVSCPIPGHRDKNPSCWMNSDKKTWTCGKCEEGGDVYDLAAIRFGYDRPDYKEGKAFHDLRVEMAESYGYRVKSVAGTELVWKEEEPAEKDLPDTASKDTELSGEVGDRTSVSRDGENTVVTVLHEKDAESDEDEVAYPTLNWREIVPQDTFLWEYIEACSNDDSPEEYHFWHGLLALAHAVGRKVYLDDTKFVYGNMLVCLLGGTGYGKSRSRAWLEVVLDEAVPFLDNGLDTSGCKQVPVPASGENLINQFQHLAHDPSLPKGTGIRTSVNGIVDYDEFAGLLARAMRQGSTLKPYVQAFADSKNRISSSSNTGGTYEAYQPFCSITASTQPKAVRKLLSSYDAGSGFLNRWLFVGGKRKKRESIGGKRSTIRVDLTAAIASLKGIRAWGATERSVELTDPGFEAFDEWFHGKIEPLQIKDDTDLLARVGLTMKRMLLLFAVNDKRTTVEAEDVERIKPLLEYLISCYGIINAEIGISQVSEMAQEIMRHIERISEQTGRGVTARELQQRLKRRNYSPDMIRKTLETLQALDWIDVDKTKGAGRPTVRYKVVAS